MALLDRKWTNFLGVTVPHSDARCQQSTQQRTGQEPILVASLVLGQNIHRCQLKEGRACLGSQWKKGCGPSRQERHGSKSHSRYGGSWSHWSRRKLREMDVVLSWLSVFFFFFSLSIRAGSPAHGLVLHVSGNNHINNA